jgi:predicted Rossmann fold flavoprotein
VTRADVVVAGAGPAGLAAAIEAAKRGRRVVLLDKAARPGVKILLSGGNRCNLTHDCDAAQIAKAFGREGARFLGSALRTLGPRELRAWIESLGVATKVEPGGKVFPVSDRATDVRDALEREMRRVGVDFGGGAAVSGIQRSDEGFVVRTNAGDFTAPRVILAIGGRSYPRVGTTGDGYDLARALGHSVVETTPALVALIVDVPWVRELSGVTLEGVEIALEIGGRVVDSRRGGFLFTHFGLSGPAPMNLGGAVALAELAGAQLVIDFVPAWKRAQLEARLVAASDAKEGRACATFLAETLPRRLADALLVEARVPAERTLAQLSRGERGSLLDAIFATRLAVSGTRGFDHAEVTRGGVPLDEVDAKTMASRRMPVLFVCGELLNLDGPIGGYNFTAAFATGRLAGESAAGD